MSYEIRQHRHDCTHCLEPSLRWSRTAGSNLAGRTEPAVSEGPDQLTRSGHHPVSEAWSTGLLRSGRGPLGIAEEMHRQGEVGGMSATCEHTRLLPRWAAGEPYIGGSPTAKLTALKIRSETE